MYMVSRPRSATITAPVVYVKYIKYYSIHLSILLYLRLLLEDKLTLPSIVRLIVVYTTFHIDHFNRYLLIIRTYLFRHYNLCI